MMSEQKQTHSTTWSISELLNQEKADMPKEDFDKSFTELKKKISGTLATWNTSPRSYSVRGYSHTLGRIIYNNVIIALKVDLQNFWKNFPETPFYSASPVDLLKVIPEQRRLKSEIEGEKNKSSDLEARGETNKDIETLSNDLMDPKKTLTSTLVRGNYESLYSVFSVRAMNKNEEKDDDGDKIRAALLDEQEPTDIEHELQMLKDYIELLSKQEGFDVYYGLLTDVKTLQFIKYYNKTFSCAEPINLDVKAEFFEDGTQMKEVYLFIAAVILRAMKDWNAK